MGPGETISFIAFLVLLVVLPALGYAAFERRLKHKELMAGVGDGTPGGEPARIVEMENRLRVLERIATERGHDVAYQIEALRDARRTEALLEARDAEVK